jgi:hypothetical protein
MALNMTADQRDETAHNTPSFVTQHSKDTETQLLARENEDLRQRLAALEQRTAAVPQGELPRYFLNEPVFLDNTYFPAGMTLDYTEEPDTSMVPQNEPAKRAMGVHLQRLSIGARNVAALRGREFLGLMTDRGVLLDRALEDAKALANAAPQEIKMPVPLNNVPAMPHLPEAQAAERRGQPKQRKAMAVPAAPQTGPEANRPTAAPRAPREGELSPSAGERRVA